MLDIIGNVLTYAFLGAIFLLLLVYNIAFIIGIRSGSFSQSKTRKGTENTLAGIDDDDDDDDDRWRISLAHPHYYEILGGEVTKSPFDDEVFESSFDDD